MPTFTTFRHRVAMIFAAAILVTGIAPASAALATPGTAAAPAATHATHPPLTKMRPDCITGGHCPIVYFTDFSTNSESGTICFDLESYNPPTLPIHVNFSDYGCRNIDEWVTSGYAARLYYSPNEGGAWVCMDANFNKSLSGVKFNNGSGDAGYNQPVTNDVASASIFSGSCSNPIN